MLVLLLVAAGVYAGSKLIPPYWAYFSLMDPVKEAGLAMSGPAASEEQIRTNLIARAKQEGVELTEDNVEILREGSVVLIRVAWEVPLDLLRYHRTLRFRLESRGVAP